jgi:hypothetical protein
MYAILTFLLALFTLPAHADDCQLPVCDIPAKIAEMREKGQAYRFDVVSKVKRDTRASRILAVHQNVVDFGTEALKLSEELGDESWMVGEAQSLLDQGRLGLLKFGPVIATDMLALYELQKGESAHYEALTFWRAALATMEDAEAIRNLIRFGVGASDISKGRQESDYIAREALTLAREATARYAIVNPAHEGMYRAILQVPEKGSVDYRLVIVETTGNSGLTVGFIHIETGRLTYLFTNATFNDLTELRADSTYYGYTARLALRYDAARGSFDGWLRDTRYPEDIGVTAALVRSPAEYFRGTAPAAIALRDLEGQYQGKIGNLEGTLIVKRFGPKLFAAAFNTKDSESNMVTIKYQTGFYNARVGVLTLVNLANDENLQKLTLAFREKAGDGVHAKLTGFNFGMNNYDAQQADLVWSGLVDEERAGPGFPGR